MNAEFTDAGDTRLLTFMASITIFTLHLQPLKYQSVNHSTDYKDWYRFDPGDLCY